MRGEKLKKMGPEGRRLTRTWRGRAARAQGRGGAAAEWEEERGRKNRNRENRIRTFPMEMTCGTVLGKEWKRIP
jgi:hypothetical protein